MKKKTLIIIFFLIFQTQYAQARMHTITAYCTCKKCCGKWADGFVASGKKAQVGMVACNYLPFGTVITIDTLGEFTVEDRGARKYFGTKDDPKYHIDILFKDHESALQFGVKHLNVERR